MAPPEPKVKISNMMRVLSADATADPTKIEQEVRRQMALRLKNHEERNAARKRTDEEKREKKINKLDKEVVVETTVHLYKVGDLKSKNTKQARYKIDMNAKQLRLHGVGVVSDDDSLLVVEGGPKALAKFQKLLLKRIKVTRRHRDTRPHALVRLDTPARPCSRYPSVRRGACRSP